MTQLDLFYHAHTLSNRQMEIVRLVAEGESNKMVAYKLNLSPGTIKVYLYTIFRKLECDNRVKLANWYHKNV